jgi:hypothetical protein
VHGQPGGGVGTITWHTVGGGTDSSIVLFTGALVGLSGPVQTSVALGTVVAGRYAGHLVTVTVVLITTLDNVFACFTTKGVTFQSGIATLAIV